MAGYFGFRSHLFRRTVLLLALVIVTVPAPLLVNAFSQPYRVTHNASPEPIPTQAIAEPSVEGGIRIPAGPAIDEGSSGANVRSRTDRAGSDRIPDDSTPDPTVGIPCALPERDRAGGASRRW